MAVVLDILVHIIFDDFNDSGSTSAGYGYISTIYFLAMIIPGLAVAVRRLHDTGKSGFFILLAFIPLIGAIWILILLFTDSDFGENKYGPNPKGIGNTDEIDQIGSYITA